MHLVKAPPPNSSIPSERVREVSDLQSMKAFSPISLTVPGMVTEASALHLMKASSPMMMRLSGRVNVVRWTLSLKEPF